MRSQDFRNAFRIAFRYFFSRKSTNAVHVISIVSVAGIALVTFAMVAVLSVFNGFELFTSSQFTLSSPKYIIERSDGQRFDPSDLERELGYSLASWSSGVLTSQAVARCGEQSAAVRIYGIHPEYLTEVVPLPQSIYEGTFDIGSDSLPFAVLGIGLALALDAGAGYSTPVEIILPNRLGTISPVLPMRGFQTRSLHVTGVYNTEQPEVQERIYLPLGVARELLQYDSPVVNYLALYQSVASADVKRIEQDLRGTAYRLLDQMAQHPAAYKVIKVEKWVSFALLLFVLLLSLFSVISTLGMLIIEKRPDVHTLRALGARPFLIDQIILFEGWLLSTTGLVIGLLLGSLAVWLQDQFQFLKFAGGEGASFLIDAYPVDYRFSDILLITLVILLIGFCSSLLARQLFRWNRD